MSSRALRRLTENTNYPDSNELHFEEPLEPGSPPISSFSSFNLLARSSDDACHPVEASDEEVPIATKSRRKRKPKKKVKKSHDVSNDEEIDHQNSERATAATSQPHSSSYSGTKATNLLTVSAKMLDPVMELNRLFETHARALGTNDQPHSSSQSTPYRTKRGPLVRIKHSWSPIVRFGLDMERLPSGSYTFTHGKEYRNVQKKFYSALDSMDPNNLMLILADCPYHIDSLLQLSEILMHQDNSEMGSDLLERVLHAYQSAFDPSFNPLLGTCRLQYNRQENRGLYVALFRYIQYIGTRGCYRTALDYCKILFSLDVDDDPLAVLLMIDQYALLSSQFEWFLSFYDYFNPSRNLQLLPNFAFSVSLAVKFLLDSDEKLSTNRDPDLLLQDALILFPGFLTRLMKHASIGTVTNLDRSVLFGQEVQREPASLGRLLDLYVARTHHLWTAPALQTWLESNIVTVLGLVEPKQCPELTASRTSPDNRLLEYAQKRKTCFPALPVNVLRHLILSDLPEAPPIIPPNLHATQIYGFDPLPPKDSIDIYNPEEERRLRRVNEDQNFLSAFLSSLLPNYPVQRAIREAGAVDDAAGVEVPPTGSLLASAAERLTATLRRILDFHGEDEVSEAAREDPTEI